MKKKQMIAAIALLTFLASIFFLKSVLRREDAVKTVRAVLKHWRNGDLTLAMPYWEAQEDSPPVYDLMAYEIGEGEVIKKDGMYHARVSAVLEFPQGNPFPSGKKWSFQLMKTRYGWKIKDFVISENLPAPY
ncbi:MAG: hypothetical protein A3C36_00580 [Omnitrophica WOR_2 bacterium RIFCSPHIGHO2_02_FULL_52_10]|nr:MAG: hypothetical protein A3C36_00580 [Omnitrophica WOR_2 bacterium RIFCSPHIGHO2_02_FULL_52_10]